MSRQTYTYSDVKQVFKKSGCQLHTRKSEYKNVRQKLSWTCSCGKNKTCSISSLTKMINDPDMVLKCRSCAARKAFGGIEYKDFVKMVGTEGWKVLSPESEFTNTKALMRVRLPSGTETTTTYSRFKAGHRSMEEMADGKRNTQKKAKEEFAKRGFTLENEYTDAKTSMVYICTCGRESKCSLGQLRKNKTGVCYECARKNKRVEWSDVEGYFDKAGCTLVTKEDEYLNNAQPIEYICWCGKPGRTAWKVFRKGTRCHDCGIESRKQTNLERYGVENPSQNEDIKQKMKDYFMREYGVDCSLKIPEVRAKIEATNLKKYGYKYAFAMPHIIEKAREAHFMKYGVMYGTQYAPTKEKIKKVHKERYGVEYPTQRKEYHENIEKKFGSRCYVASESGKKHMKEKYGEENAMHCPELFRKMQRKAFSTKSYTLPSGKVILLQGYENKCMDRYLIEEKYSEDDVVMAKMSIPYYFEGKKHKYYPDIYIKSENKIVEVKSDWTYNREYEKNVAKWKATVEAGYETYVEVYDSKKLIRIEFINDNLVILFDDEPEVEDYVVITLED